MKQPRSETLNSSLAVCGIISAGLFAAKTAFSAPGWVWVAGVLFLALAVTAALAQSSASGRAYLSGTLRTRHYTQVYRLVARRLNDWVWRRVGRMRVLPDGTEAPPSEAASPFQLLRTALTWRLLDRALFVAVAYPIIALILPWLLGGDTVLGAGVVVFLAAEFWPQRAITLGLFVITMAGLIGGTLVATSPRRFRRLFAVSLLFVASTVAGVGVVAVVFGGASVGVFAAAVVDIVAVQVAFAIAVAFAGAIAGTVAGAGVVAVSVGFAVSVAVSVSLSVAVAVQVAGAGIVAVSVGFALAFAVVGTVALTLAGARDWLWSRGRQGTALALLAVVWALMLMAVVMLFDLSVLSADLTAIFVFLAVLPLINGLFDAISYAITLALSRKGLSTRWAPLLGLLDLALGAVLFLILGATMVAAIAALNALGTAPLYDLRALFAGLRASPRDYWWLYLILFSTLAPTALHILVAALAVQGWFIFHRPRRAVAGWIEAAPRSIPAAVGGCLAQTLIWWLPLMALCGVGWAFWQVIGTAVGAAGLFYLERLEGLARWISAI